MTTPGDLVEAALLLFAQARAGAVTPRDRQTVAIAAAYLSGDLDRFEVLAREHLLDHPDNHVVDRIRRGDFS